MNFNATINATISVSAVEGDYNLMSGKIAQKLLILDSDIQHLPNNITNFFPNLHYFGVVRSNLEFVKRESFQGLQLLKTLDMKRNKLETLPEDVFLDLLNLRKIDLTGNLIKILPNDAFSSLFHLTKFIANENSIELFDSDIFSYNQKFLDEIHLWHNKIKAIRFDAKKFTNLAVIDLRDNVCIDEMFYLTYDMPVFPVLQKKINQKCSSYVKMQGQLVYRRSRFYN